MVSYSLKQAAINMAATCPELRVVFNELDGSEAPASVHVRHFLKLNGTRLGRDFEDYALMASVKGLDSTLDKMLDGILLPLRERAPEAFKKGLVEFFWMGADIGINATPWAEQLHRFAPQEFAALRGSPRPVRLTHN